MPFAGFRETEESLKSESDVRSHIRIYVVKNSDNGDSYYQNGSNTFPKITVIYITSFSINDCGAKQIC